jgi:hypothetical protein
MIRESGGSDLTQKAIGLNVFQLEPWPTLRNRHPQVAQNYLWRATSFWKANMLRLKWGNSEALRKSK